MPSAPAAGAPCAPSQLPRTRIWRLTSNQYLKTVRAAFGYTVGAVPSGVQDLGGARTGFNNEAEANHVTDLHAEFYSDTASAVARQVVSRLSTTQPCMSAPDAACVREFVRGNGERAFRRPPTDEEIARYTRFFDESKAYGVALAAQMVMEAMLQSPHFLYRTELGSSRQGTVELTPFEQASALSYTLTDAPPDATLMAAARTGALATAAGRERAARDLVARPEAREVFGRFLIGQLHLERLSGTIDATLANDMMNETRTFGGAVLGDANGTFQTLFGAPYSFVNDRLARTYGVQAAGSFARVELDPRQRAGLFTQLAFLVAVPKPVQRAVAFKEAFLCETLPDPPPEAQETADAFLQGIDQRSTAAEKWQAFQKLPQSCVTSCHSLFHPMALAFDSYDELGRYREVNQAGRRIVTAGSVAGAEGWSGMFTDARDLIRQVAESRKGPRCFVERYADFAWGRRVDPQKEACTLGNLEAQFTKSRLNLQSLLVAATQDEAFYRRRNEE